MTRAHSDVDEFEKVLVVAVDVVRQHVLAQGATQAEDALAVIETFCAISLNVMRKTNPSKIRSAARTVEISARIHGRAIEEA